MTRLGDRIPVAPLDDVTLRRVEDRAVDAMSWEELAPERARPAWLRFAPLAAAAVVLAVGAAVLGSFWSRGGDTKTPVAEAPMPQPGPAVATGPGERATVQLGDASLRVGESTRLSVDTATDGATVIYLEHGRVECDVTPRPQRPAFLVIAGEVTVRVVGTRFSVDRNGDDVKVEVTRGKVEVIKDGQSIFLPAGERWPAPAEVATNDHEHELDHEPEHESPTPNPNPNPIPKPIPKPKGITIPAGLPAPHSCTGFDTCWPVINNTYKGPASQALYTLIRVELEQGNRELARKHIELYERRFPTGAERAAVKTLRKLAE